MGYPGSVGLMQSIPPSVENNWRKNYLKLCDSVFLCERLNNPLKNHFLRGHSWNIQKISCPPVLLSKKINSNCRSNERFLKKILPFHSFFLTLILNSLVKNSTFKRNFSLFFIPPQKIITKFSPVCSVLNFLINKSKEILTFVDSIESQQNKYIRKSFLKIFYENTCASLKNVITLQPQTRNNDTH